MGRVYKNPPIVEAICEIRFAQDADWDMTIFGRFYEKIADQFPERHQQIRMQTQFPPGATETGIGEVEPRMRFARTDQSALVQLAPHRLIVNQLAPYPSWVVFKSFILDTLALYRSVAESTAVERIGLRYINRFTFPGLNFRIGKWFDATDYLPNAMLDTGAPYFVRLEFPFAPDRRVFLTTATIDEQEGDGDLCGVILDIDCVTQPQAGSEQIVADMLENGHTAVEQIFESFLTEDLRISLGTRGESE